MIKYDANTDNLAKTVFSKLNNTKNLDGVPSLTILEELFRKLFLTSIKTEEAQSIKVTITFIDPAYSTPEKERHQLENSINQWSCSAFKNNIDYTVKNLVKLSKAADPWSSSLAVNLDHSNKLVIWGMIDQAIHYQSFLNYEGESELYQPGLFQVTITDIGCLTVMYKYELLATLKQDILITNYIDIFNYGPISKLVNKFSSSFQSNITEFHNQSALSSTSFPEYWQAKANLLWIQNISRILLRIQNYQHGGALIITEKGVDNLDVKYEINYNRINKSTNNLLQVLFEYECHYDKIFLNHQSGNRQSKLPYELHRGYEDCLLLKESNEKELKGALRFSASLSCVDGLIAMTPSLEIMGFGAVIKISKIPEKVYLSTKANVSNVSDLIETNSENFGTRHRSMFAYCSRYPGALGFVVSQDGDIRAISKIDGKLIMWENIKIKQIIKSRLLKRKSPSV